MLESTAIPIGRINLLMKLTRKPSSGNPNAGFDEAGAGNVLKLFQWRASSRPYFGGHIKPILAAKKLSVWQ